MNYPLQLQIDFEQLLQLIRQLSTSKKEKVMEVLSGDTSKRWMPVLPLRTVAQIKSAGYTHPKKFPSQLCGSWEGDESAEELIQMREK